MNFKRMADNSVIIHTDIMTLRKLITLKDNGMTLKEAAEGVMLWHTGNESEQEGITPYQTDTHNGIQHDNSDMLELKDMIHKQNELIEGLTKRLDQQQEYIEQSINQRDQKLLWRKLILAIVMLIALGGLTYIGIDKLNGSTFTVDEKDGKLDPDLKNYYEHLQVNTDIRGFKTFDAYENDKAIILSLGEERRGNSIEVLDIEHKNGRMIVNVRTFENQSSEKNPSVIILLDKLEPNIDIKDTDGTIYKEVQ